MGPLIAPSILVADFSKLGEEIRAVEKAGADILHIDIMDGHFVPNLTMGPDLVRSIRPLTKLPFDVHLMVEHPEKFIESFAKAGADWMSVHLEVCDLLEVLPKIKKLGCKAGAVINPETPIQKILPFVPEADFILVMTVNPGFAGQRLISEALEKVKLLVKYRKERKLPFLIEVDGGINLENISEVHEVGADKVVVGSGLFKTNNYHDTVRKLRRR